MTYTKLTYLAVFLPIVVLIYNCFKQKHRWIVLLLASYIFFWSISGKLLIYLIGATAVTYICGLLLNSKQEERNSKLKDLEKEKKKEIKQLYVKKQRKIILLGSLILIGMVVILK